MEKLPTERMNEVMNRWAVKLINKQKRINIYRTWWVNKWPKA